MSKTIIELSDLICQTLTVRYAPHRRQALAQAAKEMGSTVEQIMASYLAHQIARRFDLTPKAGDKPSAGGDSSANSRSVGEAGDIGRLIRGHEAAGGDAPRAEPGQIAPVDRDPPT